MTMQKQIENQNKEIEDLRLKFAEAQKKLKKNAAKKLKAVNPQQSDGDASELEDQVPEETEVKEERKSALLKELKEKQKKNELKVIHNQH
mgnify:FL=1